MEKNIMEKNNKVYLICGGNGGSLIETSKIMAQLKKTHSEVIIISPDEANDLGIPVPIDKRPVKPFILEKLPDMEIDITLDMLEPPRKKNRKQKNNIFGSSKYF